MANKQNVSYDISYGKNPFQPKWTYINMHSLPDPNNRLAECLSYLPPTEILPEITKEIIPFKITFTYTLEKVLPLSHLITKDIY